MARALVASSCLANKNETPITYDRFFLPSWGCNIIFVPPTTYPPAYLTGYVGILLAPLGSRRKDAGVLRGGNILDSINSQRERLAATHELFDVVDLSRKHPLLPSNTSCFIFEEIPH